MAEVRFADLEDGRRELAVEMMKRHLLAAGISVNYDADLEYMDRALVAFADEWAPDMEQAWRNGWGSALNFLSAADLMAEQHDAEKGERHILHDLITKWVEIIDSLTDQAVGQAREIGFAAPSSEERS